MVGSAHPTFF